MSKHPFLSGFSINRTQL